MAQSPYVSYAVLEALAKSCPAFPYSVALDVLLANPSPTTEPKFLLMLETETTFPTYMIDMIANNTGQSIHRDQLEENLAKSHMYYGEKMTPIVFHRWRAEDCTTAERIELLEPLHCINSELQIIDMLWEQGNGAEAQERLDSLDSKFGYDHRAKREQSEYMVWMDVVTNNASLDNLSTVDQNKLRNLATNYYYTTAGVKASAVLNHYYHEDHFIPPYYGIGSASVRSLVTSVNVKVEVHLLTLYPNPANELVQLKLSLGNTKLSDETVSILDANGRLIETILVTSGDQQLVIDTRLYATGTYQAILNNVKGFIESATFYVGIKSILKRANFCWLFLTLWITGISGQTTFSRRHHTALVTTYNSVQVLTDGYLVGGVAVDSIPSTIYGQYAFNTVKFDFNGEVIFEKLFDDSNTFVFTSQHCLSFVNNLYLQHSISIDQASNNRATLTWYDNLGDTLQTKSYYSPYFLEGGNEYINPRYTLLMPDSTIYFTAGISDPTTGNDVCIWHIDKHGNELWHYIYANEADPETCYAMIPWQGGVMAAIFKGDSGSDNDGLILLQLNDSGQYVSEIDKSVWDNYSRGLRSLLLDDNELVCAGSIWQDTSLDPQMGLWKITTTGSLIWTCPIGVQLDYDSQTLVNLVKVNDGNYVVTGDYVWYEGEDFNSDVRVVKINNDSGQIIWTRYYNYVESEFDIHQAIDLKATPDGGVVFCGHASDNWAQNPNLELPAQQGWIVKLDACGCLVPGCDEGCTVGIEEDESHPYLGSAETASLFKVGPNPASDYINIYLNKISNVQHSSFNIQVHDLAGNIVKSFAPHRDDTTYIVDTTGLASGEYVVSLVSEGVVLQSEKIVVAR